MEKILFVLFFFAFLSTEIGAQAYHHVKVESVHDGHTLLVDDEKFVINGMNWDYIPIGKNTLNANFWLKSDNLIKEGLHREMSLLRDMGVNVIRQYTGIPSRWITYIYDHYGIFTMLNHSFGRYGLTIDGQWVSDTDYSDTKTRRILLTEVKELVEDYKETRGLLLYLLGNENNYGLFWSSSETEDFPKEDHEMEKVGEERARPMYSLINEASMLMKSIDKSRPIALCNGDILFIDIIAEECSHVDIFGTNTYRGMSFGDIFQEVKEKLNRPILFTEFGADAFHSINGKEDEASQAFYLVENWKEIYLNTSRIGGSQNSIGGFTFQFSDGWWKYGFDDRIHEDVHDTKANWTNGGYRDDHRKGHDNMNEEWFGVCAKGPTDEHGLYHLRPRASYYALKQAHKINPYMNGVNRKSIEDHFTRIQILCQGSCAMKMKSSSDYNMKEQKTGNPSLDSSSK